MISGCAFVTYVDKGSAAAAIEQMHMSRVMSVSLMSLLYSTVVDIKRGKTIFFTVLFLLSLYSPRLSHLKSGISGIDQTYHTHFAVIHPHFIHVNFIVFDL